MSTRKSSSFWCHVLLLVVMVAGLSRPAAAQKCWSATGSTAVIDNNDFSAADQVSVYLSVLGTAPLPVVLDGRFTVSGLPDDTGSSPNGKIMWVRYIDNGNQSRVRVFLKHVAIDTDLVGTDVVPVFDSDQYLQSTSAQLRGVAIPCTFGGGFHSLTHAYFVRAELTKSGPGGTPILYLVQVCEGAGTYC